MAATVPQLMYWLAFTMSPQTADAFKKQGGIADPDAAAVEQVAFGSVVKPLLQALEACTPAGGKLWDPLCPPETLVALARANPAE
jgi:hypothetical protein